MKGGFHPLDQAELLAAVKDLCPIVVLDTAIRFSGAENANNLTGR
jgi:hypothetical protein